MYLATGAGAGGGGGLLSCKPTKGDRQKKVVCPQRCVSSHTSACFLRLLGGLSGVSSDLTLSTDPAPAISPAPTAMGCAPTPMLVLEGVMCAGVPFSAATACEELTTVAPAPSAGRVVWGAMGCCCGARMVLTSALLTRESRSKRVPNCSGFQLTKDPEFFSVLFCCVVFARSALYIRNFRLSALLLLCDLNGQGSHTRSDLAIEVGGSYLNA